jgi:Anaphase-promoting complex subunit 4 WD40 domain
VSTVVSSASSLSSQSSTVSSPKRRNRALQARLEKARSVQMALSATPNPGISNNSPAAAMQLLTSSSSSSSSSSGSPGRNIDFSATAFDASSIWGKLDFDSNVTALAFSKSGGNSSSTSPFVPPLLLAVGTESGSVSLHSWSDAKRNPLSTPPESPLGSRTGQNQQQQQQQQHSRVTIGRLDRHVRAVDLNASCTYLAAAGDDCSCTVYRLRWREPEPHPTTTSVDRDGDVGVAVSEPDTDPSLVTLLESVERVAQIPRVDRVYAVAFGGDAYLAVGGFDGIVAVVSTADWQCVAEIARDGLVYSVDWSFDARHLAIAGSDKTLAVVDTRRSWGVWKEIKTGSTSTQVVRFRPHSYSLAVAGTSSLAVIKEWTVKHQSNLSSSPKGRRSSEKLYKIQSLSWSPTGTYLVMIDSQNTCKLLETSGYSIVHEFSRPSPLRCVAWGEQCQFSGLPRRYISVGGDGNDSQVVIIKAGLEFHSSGGSVVSGADDYSASAASTSVSSIARGSYLPDWTMQEHMFRNVDEILDLSTSRVVVEQESVLAVGFSRGSRSRPSTYLAYSLDDGRVIVRSTLEWKVVAELLFSKPIKCLDFSMGSRFLALGSAESRVHVVETAPAWTIVAKHDFFAPVCAVGFSRRNERLAVGVADGILALFDPQDDYASVGEIDVSESAVLSLDWSGKNFCLGRQDGTVSIFDSQQVCANFCVPLAEHELCSPVHAVAFGPSSRFVAAGAANGLVNVYSAKGGWVLCQQIRGPAEGLASLSWNASGRLLALGGNSGTVKMVDTIFWADVEEFDELMTTEQTRCETPRVVSSMAFGQDGVAFVCVSPDGNGLRVVDTNKWKLVFSHQEDEEAEATAGDISSVSSY